MSDGWKVGASEDKGRGLEEGSGGEVPKRRRRGAAPNSIYMRLPEVGAALGGLGRNRVGDLAANRERNGFPAIKVGGVWLVHREKLKVWAETWTGEIA